MIIKSHIRGGYRAAADYLKAFGKNEKIRTVEISDMDAKNLDEAFHKMWEVASNSKVKKPLHHISINPFWDERLTKAQVLKIVERCEEKYGYKHGDHQRVIVEHIKDGRQHFHVIWNRVSMATGRAVWPGHHWNKSKQAAREMEAELGLKRPVPRRYKRMQARLAVHTSGTSDHLRRTRGSKRAGRTDGVAKIGAVRRAVARKATARTEKSFVPVMPMPSTKKWPAAAVLDWEVWGHKNPARFFALWPELAPDGFTPFSGLQR
ncbi:MAG: relaxase/mobilization nuclease domain-containing protein [Alphaproteobacteria bacterium]|nr:relaxase/mobilization nuclease domain-containing protein [Alphaproteobacteria bacterium]